MLRELISNNDELQIVILVLLEQFRFQRGECLDDAHQVLVWADPSSIEQERIRNLVSLGEELPVGISSVPTKEALINRVINNLDLIWINPKQLLHLRFCKTRNGKDS